MQVEEFTDQTIEEFPPRPSGRYDVWEKGTGFGVRVTPTNKIFFIMTRINEKQKRIEIGRFPQMHLADARAKATEMKREIAKGRDLTSEDKLKRLEKQAMQNFRQFLNLTGGDGEIVFYAETSSDWRHFERIVISLINDSGKTVCYVTSDQDDPLLDNPMPGVKPFFIGYRETRTEFFETLDCKVMIMTMPDLERFNIKRSIHRVHYVYVFHTLISTHMGYMSGAFDHYDSILCAGPHHMSEIKATEKLYGAKRKALVECGHGMLDYAIDYWREHGKSHAYKIDDQIRVIVAPTYGPQSLIEIDDGQFCADLIDVLISAGMQVTLRPHWLTTQNNPSTLVNIGERHADNQALTIEKQTDTLTSLYNSDVLICDLSGVAMEYAFGFLKPVAYIDLPQRVRNAKFEDMGLPALEIEMRGVTGAIIDPMQIDKAPDVIHNLLKDKNGFVKQCVTARKKWVYNNGTSGKVGADHILSLVERKASTAAFPEARSPAISLSNASVVYDNDFTALQPTNVEFLESNLTVLLGPSGAGKSTLLRSMNGLAQLSGGEVRTNDLGVLSSKSDWRTHQQRTAMVFQSHQLIEHQTALTNVLIGRLGYRSRLQTIVPFSRADKMLALECLERVGMLDNALKRISNLSGGEKQRVGIARALVQQPTMVLADEPVASLDPSTSRKVMGFFRKICDESKLTVIVSLHQVDIAKEFADNIIGVSAGRILFNGTDKELSLEQLRIIYGTAEGNE